MDAVRGRWLVVIACSIAAQLSEQSNPDFVRDVQPVIAAKCLGCHGSKLQMHGLRLDRRADALRGGESGVPAIVPRNSVQSLLIRYVAGLDPQVVMRPSGPRLSADQVGRLFLPPTPSSGTSTTSAVP
jgi:hypothetical protein